MVEIRWWHVICKLVKFGFLDAPSRLSTKMQKMNFFIRDRFVMPLTLRDAPRHFTLVDVLK